MERQNCIIGTLFLSAFPLYGIGSNLLVESSSSSSNYVSFIGLVLVMANSLVVFNIGRMLKVIAIHHNEIAANIYYIARFLEALLLAINAFLIYEQCNGKYTNSGKENFACIDAARSNHYLYNYAMIGLGFGSLPILNIFRSVRIMPSWLAVLGLIGYSFVIVGTVLDGLQIVGDPEHVVELMIPGALFEICFACWLIIYGFPTAPYEVLHVEAREENK